MITKSCCRNLQSNRHSPKVLLNDSHLTAPSSKSVRVYGLPNRSAKFRKMNPKGKDSKVMRCRQCDFTNHFIRGCPQAHRAALVNLVLNGTLEVDEHPDELSTNQVMDIFQQQIDEVWLSITKNLSVDKHNTDPNQPPDPEISEIFFVNLKRVSDQHEFLKKRTNSQISNNQL